MNESPLIRVIDNVSALHPRIGPDSVSTLMAMISRSADIESKVDKLNELFEGRWDIDQPPERVRKFLTDNVGSYNHASIADMANASFIISNIGWPAAWALEDFPLFSGQEISTRAVNMGTVPDAQKPCLLCPPQYNEIHAEWFSVFNSLQAKSSGNYKFDEIRWALPGSYRTGVGVTSSIRSIMRQAGVIKHWSPELYEMIKAGCKATSPVMTEQMDRAREMPHDAWSVRLDKDSPLFFGATLDMILDQHSSSTSIGFCHPEKSYKRIREEDVFLLAREKPFTYSYPESKALPRWKVSLQGSLSVARDWHRHRPVMPWTLTIPVTSDGYLVPTLAKSFSGFREFLRTKEGLYLWKRTSNLVLGIVSTSKRSKMWTTRVNWDALYALPLGAQVGLECLADYPDLLYMAELRANAAGANMEYRLQALSLLGCINQNMNKNARHASKIGEAIDKIVETLPDHQDIA